MRFRFWSVLLFALPVELAAADPAAELFAAKIYPVLKKDCFGCHGDGQAMAKLDLRTRESMLKGGTRGPAVRPGEASNSLLYKALRGGGDLMQMPPGDASKRLPADVIDAVREWIDAGVPWTERAEASAWGAYEEKDLWAFRPLRKKFAHSTIDGFIREKLAGKGLEPAPRAERRTLIRRVTIDLTGIPPAPEEVAAFVDDDSPDTWQKLVDRLLASPRYGERWGRHWLDVVRYADSSGYSNDFERPNAWRYRDYVIRAFNADKPYDQFVREQIAGDELYPDNPEATIATGFLRSGPWEHTAMSVEAVTRQMFLDDVTNSVGVTFMGLALGCARCHDHKFDPIPTRDYYGTQAIFATTEFARPELPFLVSENTSGLDEGRAHMQEIVRRTKEGLDSFEEKIKGELMKQHGVSSASEIPAAELKAALQTKKLLTPEEFEQFKLYQKHMQLHKESLDRYEPKAFAVSSGPLDGYTDGGSSLKYPKRSEYKGADVHILPGGNIQSPAEKVGPEVPGLVQQYSGLKAPEIPGAVEGRRAAFANWIAHSDHPLTARVMVNRIWQGHFGAGLAADPNNLGKTGKKPTHPELLDWLARQFIESGWSVKTMHRLILNSQTYQSASDHPAMDSVKTKDPNNELLSYYRPMRVEAEVLRDAILAVSGELSPDAGGPGAFPQINQDVARQPLHRMGSLAPAYQPSAKKRDRNRRTIYMFQQRSLVDPMVEVFNGPNLDLSCERREASTVPTQAFTLLNSQFVHDMALALAARVGKERRTTAERIARVFERVYARNPSEQEAGMSLVHVQKMTDHHRAIPPPQRPAKKPLVHVITSELTGERSQFTQQDDPAEYEENLHPAEVNPETRALADLALVLLNSNEFVYVY
jgi:Protein of unknown function (DUF1549)/Protein of unknown function (DUF1553)/Planctomycete cytochrome C